MDEPLSFDLFAGPGTSIEKIAARPFSSFNFCLIRWVLGAGGDCEQEKYSRRGKRQYGGNAHAVRFKCVPCSKFFVYSGSHLDAYFNPSPKTQFN